MSSTPIAAATPPSSSSSSSASPVPAQPNGNGSSLAGYPSIPSNGSASSSSAAATGTANLHAQYSKELTEVFNYAQSTMLEEGEKFRKLASREEECKRKLELRKQRILAFSDSSLSAAELETQLEPALAASNLGRETVVFSRDQQNQLTQYRNAGWIILEADIQVPDSKYVTFRTRVQSLRNRLGEPLCALLGWTAEYDEWLSSAPLLSTVVKLTNALRAMNRGLTPERIRSVADVLSVEVRRTMLETCEQLAAQGELVMAAVTARVVLEHTLRTRCVQLNLLPAELQRTPPGNVMLARWITHSKDKGLIDVSAEQWLQTCARVGNTAAHNPSAPPSETEVNSMLAVIRDVVSVERVSTTNFKSLQCHELASIRSSTPFNDCEVCTVLTHHIVHCTVETQIVQQIRSDEGSFDRTHACKPSFTEIASRLACICASDILSMDVPSTPHEAELHNADRSKLVYGAPSSVRTSLIVESDHEGFIGAPLSDIEWYHKAAADGHASAQFTLGVMYISGRDNIVAKDEALAVHWFLAAANQGHALAQYNLGAMYHDGWGVLRNLEVAAVWYERAAEQGLANAQFNLATMYANGRGVSKNEATAVLWYRLAAEQGHTRAQFNLGVMYHHGTGTQQDDAQAVAYYSRAANQGHASAQFNLGFMYANGLGVAAADDSTAMMWFSKAAEQGHVRAQYNLGVMFQPNICDVHWNEVEDEDRWRQAAFWLSRAAAQGHLNAQFNMGTLYARGRGVEKVDVQAVKWLRCAAMRGHEDAQWVLRAMYVSGRVKNHAQMSIRRAGSESEEQLRPALNFYDGQTLIRPFAGGSSRLPYVAVGTTSWLSNRARMVEK